MRFVNIKKSSLTERKFLLSSHKEKQNFLKKEGTNFHLPSLTDKNKQKDSISLPLEAEIQITKNLPIPLDPTRYGDWEKGGQCLEF